MNDFCESEQVIGNTTVFCLFKAGHYGPCIYADPRIIELCADRNDVINTEFKN